MINLTRNQALIVALAILVIGVLIGKWMFNSTEVVREIAKPAQILPATAASPNGGQLLAHEPGKAAAPAQALPKGLKPLVVGQITVKPTARAQAAADAAAKPDCPPVTVDFTLARDKDGIQRIAASSKDGEVIGGFEVPVAPVLQLASRPWAAGAAYSSQKNIGAWVDRDIGRLRLGVQANQVRAIAAEAASFELWAKVGFTF